MNTSKELALNVLSDLPGSLWGICHPPREEATFAGCTLSASCQQINLRNKLVGLLRALVAVEEIAAVEGPAAYIAEEGVVRMILLMSSTLGQFGFRRKIPLTESHLRCSALVYTYDYTVSTSTDDRRQANSA